jgi:hypothetical protein
VRGRAPHVVATAVPPPPPLLRLTTTTHTRSLSPPKWLMLFFCGMAWMVDAMEVMVLR